MRSAATAVAWEFRQRHRWGLIALTVYFVVLMMIKLIVVARGIPIYLDSAESFAFVVVVPLAVTFTWFLAVFSFGLDGDLAARQSMYPARMMTRPVATHSLVWWPMLYGTVAMMTLWLAMRTFALWPAGITVPLVWPALLAASLLAWTQALTWMPYPLPGLRIIVTVLWLATIDAIALLALHFNAHESLMLGILAPQIPLAYVAARFAVARARCGDVRDWRGGFRRATFSTRGSSHSPTKFGSPACAQAWFEWRQHGLSLPVWVGILLPFELVLLWAAGNSTALVFTILLAVMLTPPFMATFAAAALSKSNPAARDSYGVSAFVATRPMTNAELVAAKLTMAGWSTIAAWALVLIAVLVALRLSGRSAGVLDGWHSLTGIVGASRALIALLLILAGCITATWTQLVQSLYIGLTGRGTLIKGSVFLVLGFFVLFGPFAEWIVESGRLGEVWSALPVILASLAAVKMIAAVWIGVRLYQGRLLPDRVLVSGAACWSLAVFILYGMLRWLLDAPHIPRYLLMLVAILAIPLTRLSAAPLALTWNRHR